MIADLSLSESNKGALGLLRASSGKLCCALNDGSHLRPLDAAARALGADHDRLLSASSFLRVEI